jgi:GNAT superfamily N-acetyltransferase
VSAEVRVTVARDTGRFLLTLESVWFFEPASIAAEQQLLHYLPERRFGAELAGGPSDTYAGVYGVLPAQLAVPHPSGSARLVPMAGLAAVGVHPDARRRGVLTAMLRDHVRRTHDDGVALAGLHTSEVPIYGRHGWGLASWELGFRLGRGTVLHAPLLDEAARGLHTRLVTPLGRSAGEVRWTDGTFDDWTRRLRTMDERSATEPGLIVFDASYYATMLPRAPERLRGEEPIRLLLACDGDDVAGHAVFQRTPRWEDGRPSGEVEVHHLGGTPAARLALLRRLLDLDLTTSVSVPPVGLDDALVSWLGPRVAASTLVADNLWLRIVDLPAALAQRAYDGACDVVVRVLDPLAPWQDGVWRIEVAEGEGRATPSTADPDVALPVAHLGSLYLGGGNLVAAGRAGLVAEHRAGALRELSRAFRADTLPAASPAF